MLFTYKKAKIVAIFDMAKLLIADFMIKLHKFSGDNFYLKGFDDKWNQSLA